MKVTQYCAKKAEEIFAEFGTSVNGISENNVSVIRKKYGFNEIKEQEVHWWDVFLRQFKSSFIYLLLGAALLYFVLGEIIDGLMIMLFVITNTVLGFYQEYRSEQSLKLLKQYVTHKTKVRRDGKEELIDSRMIVPGDVVIVEAGDIISADIRFFQENNLIVNESILTGESVPIKKIAEAMNDPVKEIYQAHNIGYSGTTVVSGVGEGVVVATGKNMTIGEVASLTVETERASSFEKGIGKISTFVLQLIFLTLIFVFLANLLIKGSSANLMVLVIFSIALAVSVIPEALPVVTTFSLSRGALRLAKKKVVVRRLSSIEDLGSVEVLCTDKTGTITENELTVSEIFSQDPEKAIFYASVAFSFLEKKKKEPNNAFDLALLKKLSAADKKKLDSHERVSEIPFDPERRRNSVLSKTGNKFQLIVRGAHENIVKFSKNVDKEKKEKINRWVSEQGRMGRRVIAVAKKEMSSGQYSIPDEESGLEFLGLISFVDPIKKTTKSAIKNAGKLGVQVKILTGDSPEVAGAVGHQVGLTNSPTEVITGEQLETMPYRQQREAVHKYSVFARVSPQQKYAIIQLLQEKSEVGFLGEGINDAPALKIANVGLAVQGAADISREAADIILLKKSLDVIVDGIKEGRSTFTNTIKYIKATLASNFGNFYAVAISSMLIDYLPMLPLQILLLNLLSDFPMISIATDSIDESELRKPKAYNVREIALIATILGIVSSFFDFLVFGLFYKISPQVLQTNWFIASILTELVFLFSVRTHYVFYKAKRPSFPVMSLTVIAAMATIIIPFTDFGQRVFEFTAPTGPHLLLILLIVGTYFMVTESVKLIYYRFSGR